ncbi:MAG TPA: tRNA lysidine(34) synthetase TilS [bacterium]|nr:tRNA lysidine(34) synthetase TilS [bacterium]
MKIISQFIEGNRKSKLIREGDRVLLAFSAGPDSVALLSLLLELKKLIDFDLALAYVDHSLRPFEVIKEKKLAEAYASRYGLRIYFLKLKKLKPGNMEEKLREGRYKKLTSLAEKEGYEKIAAAHQSDDQAETFFLRLLRGTGVYGLAGMPGRRALSDRVELIRPLLAFQKREILAYLGRKKLRFCRDSSNLSNHFMRNRIRNRLLPFLKKNFMWKEAALLNLMNMAGDENSYWNKRLRPLLRTLFISSGSGRVLLAREKYLRYNNLFKKRILHAFFEGRVNAGHLERVLGLIERKRGSGRLELGKQGQIERSGEKILFISERAGIDEKKNQSRRGRVFREGTVTFPDMGVTLKFENIRADREEPDFSRSPSERIYLDAASLERKRWSLRRRLPGDRITLAGLGRKKLKKLFIDEKIPSWDRENIPVMEADGKIVWLLGIRRSADYPVMEDQNNVWKVAFEKTSRY